MKKVILFVIDACSSRVIIPAMDKGDLPGFQQLQEHGILRKNCCSVFPSITPAATSSIATGLYPQYHGIIGNFWYDKSCDEVAYYGDDFWVILKHGVAEFFEDFLIKLNHKRLDAPTLFEHIEKKGMRAASLNYMIFHGIKDHEVDVPLWFSLMPGIPFTEKVSGPSILFLGDFVSTDIPHANLDLESDGGLFKRFGFQDDFTAEQLLQLAETGALPEFTLAYFPDNDYRSHELGPNGAIGVLEHLDECLLRLYAVYGGVENFLKEFCLIITGDHSQSDIIEDESGLIALDSLLADFPQTAPGSSWDEGDRIMICPNLRTAQIYLRHPNSGMFVNIAERLLEDPRIDQLLWRDNLFGSGGKGFHVVTRDRGRLHFWPDSGEDAMCDDYGGGWAWSGDLETLDARLDGKHLRFGNYPNAFERIAGGLCCENSGQLWLTARPGYECGFSGDGFHNGGGSHGTLHILDSIAPLFVAGAPKDIDIPEVPRIVDIAGICLQVLGLSPLHQPGSSHVLNGKSPAHH